MNALLAMAVGLAACGHDVAEMAPSTPRGRITGKVLDLQGQPLAGVEVRASNGAMAVTAETGLFALDSLAAGSSVGLTFRRSGFSTGYATAVFPAGAGNLPLNGGGAIVGPLRLAPMGGDLTFNVVGHDGSAIAKPEGTLDVTPAFLELSGSGAVDPGVGNIAVQGTGQNGVLKFSGVPEVEDLAGLESIDLRATYSVYVAPVLNDDGTVRYRGATASFHALTLLTEPWTRTLVLPAPEANLPVQITAASIANLLGAPSRGRDNLAGKRGPISVVFNQRIRLEDLWVEVRNDAGDPSASVRLPVTTEINPVGNQIRIGLAAGSAFADGMKYQLFLRASSLDDPSAAPLAMDAPFFGGSADTSSANRGPGNVTVSYAEFQPPGDGKFGAGERLEIAFERYLGRGESSSFKLPVYFNYDLDGNGAVGNAVGERGFRTPLCIPAEEWVPAGVEGAKLSGYARKASIGFEEIQKAIPSLAPVVTNKAPVLVTVAFSESSKCGGPVLTVWGEPLTTDSADLTLTATK